MNPSSAYLPQTNKQTGNRASPSGPDPHCIVLPPVELSITPGGKRSLISVLCRCWYISPPRFPLVINPLRSLCRRMRLWCCRSRPISNSVLEGDKIDSSSHSFIIHVLIFLPTASLLPSAFGIITSSTSIPWKPSLINHSTFLLTTICVCARDSLVDRNITLCKVVNNMREGLPAFYVQG